MTRQPFWMLSGAIAGIVASAPGLDLYYPPLAFLIAFIGGAVAPMVDKILSSRFKLDDPVGAFGVHGASGVVGLLMLGVFSGFPNVVEGAPNVSFMGQLQSAVVMALVGFIPGYFVSLVLAKFGLLRVPPKAKWPVWTSSKYRCKLILNRFRLITAKMIPVFPSEKPLNLISE